jgi:hypothetical protein
MYRDMLPCVQRRDDFLSHALGCCSVRRQSAVGDRKGSKHEVRLLGQGVLIIQAQLCLFLWRQQGYDNVDPRLLPGADLVHEPVSAAWPRHHRERSWTGALNAAMGEAARAALIRRVGDAIAANNGSLRITTDAGLFEAW